jgi:hypothetical protein
LTAPNVGGSLFVARYAPAGELLWATRASCRDEGGIQGVALAALSDGSVAVTGGLTGTAVFAEGEANETSLVGVNRFEVDGFLAKYTPEGRLAWVKRIETVEDTRSSAVGEALSPLANGGFALGGVFHGQAVFGRAEPQQTTLVGEGSFVAHYDAQGTLVWARQVDRAAARDLATFADGTTVLVGTFNQTATFGLAETRQTTLTTRGSDDGFVASFEPNGAFGWVRQIGGYDPDLALAVAARADGASLVTGRFRGPATFDAGGTRGQVLQGMDDLFVAEYGQDGTLAWLKSAGGPGEDTGRGIGVAANGSTLVAGEINWTAFYDSATFGAHEPNEASLTGHGVFLARYGTCEQTKSGAP